MIIQFNSKNTTSELYIELDQISKKKKKNSLLRIKKLFFMRRRE